MLTTRIRSALAWIDAKLPGLPAIIMRSQILLLTMMAMGLARRRDVPAGATAIGYHKALRALMIGMIVVSLIEIPVIALLIPWEPVKIIALVLGVYSVVWIAGFAAALWVMPHVLTETELHLRYAMFDHVVVPRRLITSARTRLGSHGTKTLEVEDGSLAVGVSGATNTVLKLSEPLAVQIGRTTHEVTEIRFWADEHDDWPARLSAK